VSQRATREGPKVPRSSNNPTTPASAGEPDATLPETTAAAMKKVHVTAYVSEKNLRREATGARLTPQFSGGALTYEARRVCKMK
jgi:hypothetical protein